MKYLALLLTIIFSTCVKSQTANIVSKQEYDNIEINGITLIDIRNTLGQEELIESLFGQSVSKEIDVDGNYFDFGGFDIGFSTIMSEDNSPIIGGFDITNENYEMKIKGISFTIGDPISILGDVIFNNDTDGEKSVLFQYCEGCNNFISIDFDQETQLITAIYYIELT